MKHVFYSLIAISLFFSNCESHKNYWLSSLQGSFKGTEIDYDQANIFSEVYLDFMHNNKIVDNKIPKIIHFVWVGGKIPSIYNFCIESWRRHHPNWQVILWDDQKISSLNMQNKLVFEALGNNGAKADIVRYEILNKFGGFYVDIDFFCLKPIDFYADHATLFVGSFLEDIVGNGIIGAFKGHNFIAEIIKKIGCINVKTIDKLTPNQIMDQVGPHFFGKELNKYLKNNTKDWHNVALLPSSYLHSFPNTKRDEFWNYSKSLVQVIDEFVYPETLAVHLWSVSWVRARNDNDSDVTLFDQALNVAGQEFTSLSSVRETDGATALHVLARLNCIQELKSLALSGIDLNKKDRNGDTPLMIAVKLKNIKNAKILIEAGSNLYVRDSEGRTPLEYAKEYGLSLFVKLLSSPVFKINEPTLITMVRANHLKKVEMLLRHGYNVNVHDYLGKYPLDYAVDINNPDMIKLLTLNGAINHGSYKMDNSYELASKKIIILNCSYNNEKYCKANLESIFRQTYSNWEMYYVDDCSLDGTMKHVQDMVQRFGMHEKVHLISNRERKGALANYYHVISQCRDNDIIVVVDGDDCLYDNSVLSYVAKVYNDPNIWLTYGSYVPQYPPFPVYCREISESIPKNKYFFRRHDWRFGHLRTFYAALFKKIKYEDLIYKGKFFQSAPDFVTMMPMLEMCGAQQKRFMFINKPLYLYNNANPICEYRVEASSEVPNYVRSLQPYAPLEDLFS